MPGNTLALEGRSWASPERIAGAAIVALAAALLATPYQAAAVLVPVTLLAFLVLGRWPWAGLYLIVALIPFWELRTLPAPLEGVQLHWLVAGALVVILAARAALAGGLPAGLGARLWLPLSLFVLSGLVSALLAPPALRAAAAVGLLRLGLAAVLVALVLVLLSAGGFFRTLPAVIVASVSASALLALLGYLFGLDLFASGAGEDQFLRGSGGARDPVNLAFLIVWALPLLGLWLVFGTGPGRLVAAGLLLVNLLALVTTFARSGALLLGVVALALAVELLPWLRLRHLVGAGGALAFVLAATLLAAPAAYWERLATLRAPTDQAFQRRVAYYGVAGEGVARRPWLGHGLGAFRELYAATPTALHFAREERERFRDAHNTYLEVLVGTGVVGLAAYLFLLGVGWTSFTRARRLFLAAGDRRAALQVGAYRVSYLATLVYLGVKSGVDNKALLVSLALSAVALRLARQHPASERQG